MEESSGNGECVVVRRRGAQSASPNAEEATFPFRHKGRNVPSQKGEPLINARGILGSCCCSQKTTGASVMCSGRYSAPAAWVRQWQQQRQQQKAQRADAVAVAALRAYEKQLPQHAKLSKGQWTVLAAFVVERKASVSNETPLCCKECSDGWTRRASCCTPDSTLSIHHTSCRHCCCAGRNSRCCCCCCYYVDSSRTHNKETRCNGNSQFWEFAKEGIDTTTGEKRRTGCPLWTDVVMIPRRGGNAGVSRYDGSVHPSAGESPSKRSSSSSFQVFAGASSCCPRAQRRRTTQREGEVNERGGAWKYYLKISHGNGGGLSTGDREKRRRCYSDIGSFSSGSCSCIKQVINSGKYGCSKSDEGSGVRRWKSSSSSMYERNRNRGISGVGGYYVEDRCCCYSSSNACTKNIHSFFLSRKYARIKEDTRETKHSWQKNCLYTPTCTCKYSMSTSDAPRDACSQHINALEGINNNDGRLFFQNRRRCFHAQAFTRRGDMPFEMPRDAYLQHGFKDIGFEGVAEQAERAVKCCEHGKSKQQLPIEFAYANHSHFAVAALATGCRCVGIRSLLPSSATVLAVPKTRVEASAGKSETAVAGDLVAVTPYIKGAAISRATITDTSAAGAAASNTSIEKSQAATTSAAVFETSPGATIWRATTTLGRSPPATKSERMIEMSPPATTSGTVLGTSPAATMSESVVKASLANTIPKAVIEQLDPATITKDGIEQSLAATTSKIVREKAAAATISKTVMKTSPAATTSERLREELAPTAAVPEGGCFAEGIVTAITSFPTHTKKGEGGTTGPAGEDADAMVVVAASATTAGARPQEVQKCTKEADVDGGASGTALNGRGNGETNRRDLTREPQRIGVKQKDTFSDFWGYLHEKPETDIVLESNRREAQLHMRDGNTEESNNSGRIRDGHAEVLARRAFKRYAALVLELLLPVATEGKAESPEGAGAGTPAVSSGQSNEGAPREYLREQHPQIQRKSPLTPSSDRQQQSKEEEPYKKQRQQQPQRWQQQQGHGPLVGGGQRMQEHLQQSHEVWGDSGLLERRQQQIAVDNVKTEMEESENGEGGMECRTREAALRQVRRGLTVRLQNSQQHLSQCPDAAVDAGACVLPAAQKLHTQRLQKQCYEQKQEVSADQEWQRLLQQNKYLREQTPLFSPILQQSYNEVTAHVSPTAATCSPLSAAGCTVAVSDPLPAASKGLTRAIASTASVTMPRPTTSAAAAAVAELIPAVMAQPATAPAAAAAAGVLPSEIPQSATAAATAAARAVCEAVPQAAATAVMAAAVGGVDAASSARWGTAVAGTAEPQCFPSNCLLRSHLRRKDRKDGVVMGACHLGSEEDAAPEAHADAVDSLCSSSKTTSILLSRCISFFPGGVEGIQGEGNLYCVECSWLEVFDSADMLLSLLTRPFCGCSTYRHYRGKLSARHTKKCHCFNNACNADMARHNSSRSNSRGTSGTRGSCNNSSGTSKYAREHQRGREEIDIEGQQGEDSEAGSGKSDVGGQKGKGNTGYRDRGNVGSGGGAGDRVGGGGDTAGGGTVNVRGRGCGMSGIDRGRKGQRRSRCSVHGDGVVGSMDGRVAGGGKGDRVGGGGGGVGKSGVGDVDDITDVNGGGSYVLHDRVGRGVKADEEVCEGRGGGRGAVDIDSEGYEDGVGRDNKGDSIGRGGRVGKGGVGHIGGRTDVDGGGGSVVDHNVGAKKGVIHADGESTTGGVVGGANVVEGGGGVVDVSSAGRGVGRVGGGGEGPYGGDVACEIGKGDGACTVGRVDGACRVVGCFDDANDACEIKGGCGVCRVDGACERCGGNGACAVAGHGDAFLHEKMGREEGSPKCGWNPPPMWPREEVYPPTWEGQHVQSCSFFQYLLLTGLFRQHPCMQLHFFSSALPCGDAAVISSEVGSGIHGTRRRSIDICAPSALLSGEFSSTPCEKAASGAPVLSTLNNDLYHHRYNQCSRSNSSGSSSVRNAVSFTNSSGRRNDSIASFSKIYTRRLIRSASTPCQSSLRHICNSAPCTINHSTKKTNNYRGCNNINAECRSICSPPCSYSSSFDQTGLGNRDGAQPAQQQVHQHEKGQHIQLLQRKQQQQRRHLQPKVQTNEAKHKMKKMRGRIDTVAPPTGAKAVNCCVALFERQIFRLSAAGGLPLPPQLEGVVRYKPGEGPTMHED